MLAAMAAVLSINCMSAILTFHSTIISRYPWSVTSTRFGVLYCAEFLPKRKVKSPIPLNANPAENKSNSLSTILGNTRREQPIRQQTNETISVLLYFLRFLIPFFPNVNDSIDICTVKHLYYRHTYCPYAQTWASEVFLIIRFIRIQGYSVW